MQRWNFPAACLLTLVATPLCAQLPPPPDWSLEVKRPARRALVIGIASYDNARQLITPRMDAEQFAQTLTALNFNTVDRASIDGRSERSILLAKIAAFKAKLEPGDLAVVYYSGHGVQVNGINYLVGSDGTAKPEYPGLDWISVDYVIGEIAKAKAAVTVLVLDACRADPFTGTADDDRDIFDATTAGPLATAGVQGLAPAGGPLGPFVIAFAAQPRMVAYSRTSTDPLTTSSIYTRHLASRLVRNAPLGRALAGVDTDVAGATDGRQKPMSSLSQVWDLPMDGLKPESVTTEEEWAFVVSTIPIGQLVAQLTDFVSFHPISVHAAAARAKLAQIAAEPPSVPQPQPQPQLPPPPPPVENTAILLGALQSTRMVDGKVTAVTNSPVSVRERRKGGANFGIVSAGSRVQLLESKGHFARILAPDGRFGWIEGVNTVNREQIKLDVRLGFSSGDEFADANDWTPLGDAARKLSAPSTAVTIRTGRGSVSDVGQSRLVGRVRALRIREYVLRLGVPPERVVVLENDPGVDADEARISVLKVTS